MNQKLDVRDYYTTELEKINFKEDYPASVRFVSGKWATKNLNVNKESAKVIIERLKKEFDL